MKPLAERKQELLVACAIQREMLQLEWRLIQVKVDRWQGYWRKVPQALPFLAPAVGWFMARRWKHSSRSHPPSGKPSKLFLLYQAWQWWRLLRRRSPSP